MTWLTKSVEYSIRTYQLDHVIEGIQKEEFGQIQSITPVKDGERLHFVIIYTKG